MSNSGDHRKVTRVGGSPGTSKSESVFVASKENVAKAKQQRLFAVLAWLVAIGLQVYAIFFILLQPPVNMGLLIGVIAVNLVLALVGSWLWKKANRLDPASEANPTKFFIQNQLGAIMGVLAFLPLVIMIFMNKDLSGKQKGIVGSIAVVAMLIAGISGVDFDPPSIEQYTDQIREVEDLTGQNFVYWTPSGTRYHLYDDCSHITSGRTSEVYEGGVAEARELKNITELCQRCRSRAERDREISTPDLQQILEDAVEEAVEQE
jgi:hypothetical protein